jgi:hypothetical protein
VPVGPLAVIQLNDRLVLRPVAIFVGVEDRHPVGFPLWNGLAPGPRFSNQNFTPIKPLGIGVKFVYQPTLKGDYFVLVRLGSSFSLVISVSVVVDIVIGVFIEGSLTHLLFRLSKIDRLTILSIREKSQESRPLLIYVCILTLVYIKVNWLEVLSF